jgi:hypothetical protein
LGTKTHPVPNHAGNSRNLRLSGFAARGVSIPHYGWLSAPGPASCSFFTRERTLARGSEGPLEASPAVVLHRNSEDSERPDHTRRRHHQRLMPLIASGGHVWLAYGLAVRTGSPTGTPVVAYWWMSGSASS